MNRLWARKRTIGAERKGVRGDIRLVHSKERPSVDREPTSERGEAMVNSIRFYGAREGNSPAEAMTAMSAALYEYLMARARPKLQDNEPCLVSFADAKAYLQLEKTSRLREYMSALSSTWVSYDFLESAEGFQKIGRRVQLMNCSEVISPTQERFIEIEMFPSVRKAILSAEIYTHVELGAFPRFSSKYTQRLYPKLALMAGRDTRPPMRWTPEELAEQLGWRPDTWKFGNFEARVLKPVLADIQEHVRRFVITCEYVKGSGRGHPVTEIVITVGKAISTEEEIRKADMDKSDRTRIRRIAADAAVDLATQMPGDDILRRAATRLSKPVTIIATMWAEAFADEGIMDLMQREGLKVAFEEWVMRQEARQGDDDVDFDTANAILVTLADGYDLDTATSAIEGHLWTGSSAKTIRILWNAAGEQHEHDIQIIPTERDLALLLHANQDIIEDMEYVA
ncbi:replication initiation protein [Rhizobium lentis]|uniref:replication initiation protein n=1 Tax=Rhizobium lentis TaxID=1138194 RepID=UPI001C82A0D5|nr:replication initiation protein [Rhizobium lentis]MBX5111993.1 replication initiation protein [Rhizobium lentis]